MNVVHFTDLRGRRYAVPEEVLAVHEIHGVLPEDERLTGLEADPPPAPGAGESSAANGYVWKILASANGEALEYGVVEATDRMPGREAAPDAAAAGRRGSG